MGRRRKVEQEQQEYAMYRQALAGKQVPLLTLDMGWHNLFPDFRKNKQIKHWEKELNKLIRMQGQSEHDLKDMEQAKKMLMENVVQNMTDGHEFDSPIRQKKQERNQKLLAQLNEKVIETKELQRRLPAQIQEANQALLVECMRVCYQELQDNTVIIEEEEEQILALRETLKDHILRKQDKEMRNTQVYKYMHNLLGAEVVEVFDREHTVWKGNIEETKIEE